MATSKKKTQSGKTKRAAVKKPTKAQQQSKKQLGAVLLFAVGVLLVCVAVIEGGALWRTLHEVLRGLFSWCAFLVGPIAIYAAIMLTLDKSESSVAGKAISAFLLILLCSGAIQIFSGLEVEGSLLEMMRTLYAGGKALSGGGAMSLLFGVSLLRALGDPGASIVIVLLIFVFLMILSGSTLIGLFRGAAKPVKKIEEAYTSAVANRPVADAHRNPPPNPNFNIDVPLDDTPAKAKPAPAARRGAPEASAAKEKLLASASGTAVGPNIYDFESEADAHAPIPASESVAPSLEDLISRAVSGTAVVGGHTQRGDGRLGFGGAADAASQPAQAAQPAAPSAAPAQPPVAQPYVYPTLELLNAPARVNRSGNAAELKANADLLVDTLKSFGVQTRVINISRGPTVTRYELQPSAGVKISRITNLADDIALNLAAAGVRIEAPIPNKAAIGIEVPNKVLSTVPIREVLDSKLFEEAKSPLTVALGKDISGAPIVADLSRMPHTLIAGSTGSGKSVCINCLIMSLLYKSSPDELKLLMIDPKVVELGGYNGLPHLLVPVVTEPRKATGALGSAVGEMLRRYQVFADAGVRDINTYNTMAKNNELLTAMPHIVIIIDELADLMMSAPKDVEDHVCRIAQMGRAAGIHLVVATQRPSVDVITGLIKANIPSRISFAVSSQVDSRTILDMGGAEKLLGRGDMLYYPLGAVKPQRVQCCFVADEEVERVIAFIKESNRSIYDEEFMSDIEKQAALVKGKGGSSQQQDADDDTDELFDNAVQCVVEAGQASTSLLQRRLKVGYARAARLVDIMEQRGIVGPFEGSKPRAVLLTRDQYYEMKLRND